MKILDTTSKNISIKLPYVILWVCWWPIIPSTVMFMLWFAEIVPSYKMPEVFTMKMTAIGFTASLLWVIFSLIWYIANKGQIVLNKLDHTMFWLITVLDFILLIYATAQILSGI